MTTGDMIRELRRLEEAHKDDFVGTCETNWSLMCRDVANRLEELLATQEPVEPNGKQYQCNKCKFYQGVHNVMGHAPCSFWNIGGVIWDDYCSRFSQFTDK